MDVMRKEAKLKLGRLLAVLGDLLLGKVNGTEGTGHLTYCTQGRGHVFCLTSATGLLVIGKYNLDFAWGVYWHLLLYCSPSPVFYTGLTAE